MRSPKALTIGVAHSASVMQALFVYLFVVTLQRVSSSHAKQSELFGPVHALHPAAQAKTKQHLNGYCQLYIPHDYAYLPIQFPDESWNVPSLHVSAVHRLGAAPCRVSELLQVKQYAGLTGFEQVAQETSHTVEWICKKSKFQTINPYKMTEYCQNQVKLLKHFENILLQLEGR